MTCSATGDVEPEHLSTSLQGVRRERDRHRHDEHLGDLEREGEKEEEGCGPNGGRLVVIRGRGVRLHGLLLEELIGLQSIREIERKVTGR